MTHRKMDRWNAIKPATWLVVAYTLSKGKADGQPSAMWSIVGNLIDGTIDRIAAERQQSVRMTGMTCPGSSFAWLKQRSRRGTSLTTGGQTRHGRACA